MEINKSNCEVEWGIELSWMNHKAIHCMVCITRHRVSLGRLLGIDCLFIAFSAYRYKLWYYSIVHTRLVISDRRIRYSYHSIQQRAKYLHLTSGPLGSINIGALVTYEFLLLYLPRFTWRKNLLRGQSSYTNNASTLFCLSYIE